MNAALPAPTRSLIDARTAEAVSVCRARGDLAAAGDPARTLGAYADVLAGAGFTPRRSGRAVVWDLPAAGGAAADGRRVLLRAAVTDEHDELGAVPLVAAALVLRELAAEGAVDQGVRFVLDEVSRRAGVPGVTADGVLDGVDHVFAVGADPGLPPAHVGISSGAVAYATDRLSITLAGPGGHTARPHLTTDLVTALAKVATELPVAVSRRLDPRAAFRLDWHRAEAGEATNVIPQTGSIEGIVRVLDADAWRQAPELVQHVLSAVVAPYDAKWSLEYRQGDAPVVNGSAAVVHARTVAFGLFRDEAIESAVRLVGAYGLGAYLDRVPGALVRVGPGGDGDGAVAAARLLAGVAAHACP